MFNIFKYDSAGNRARVERKWAALCIALLADWLLCAER